MAPCYRGHNLPAVRLVPMDTASITEHPPTRIRPTTLTQHALHSLRTERCPLRSVRAISVSACPAAHDIPCATPRAWIVPSSPRMESTARRRKTSVTLPRHSLTTTHLFGIAPK